MKLIHKRGQLVDVNNSDVCIMMDECSYAAFVGVLSNIFMKAHLSSPFRTAPYSCSLIVSPSMLRPIHNQPDSSVDRICEIISQMKKPDGDIELGIFTYDNQIWKDGISFKHTATHCWAINNTTDTKHLITANISPARFEGNAKNQLRCLDKQILAVLPAPISYIDYSTSIHEVFSTLAQSKVHICYQGGTSWLSLAMGIPTVIVHTKEANDPFNLKWKIFGQELGNINWVNQSGELCIARTHPLEFHTTIDNIHQTVAKAAQVDYSRI